MDNELLLSLHKRKDDKKNKIIKNRNNKNNNSNNHNNNNHHRITKNVKPVSSSSKSSSNKSKSTTPLPLTEEYIKNTLLDAYLKFSESQYEKSLEILKKLDTHMKNFEKMEIIYNEDEYQELISNNPSSQNTINNNKNSNNDNKSKRNSNNNLTTTDQQQQQQQQHKNNNNNNNNKSYCLLTDFYQPQNKYIYFTKPLKTYLFQILDKQRICFVKLGNIKEACKCALQLTHDFPNDPRGFFSLGRHYESLGEIKLAINAYKAGLNTNNDNNTLGSNNNGNGSVSKDSIMSIDNDNDNDKNNNSNEHKIKNDNNEFQPKENETNLRNTYYNNNNNKSVYDKIIVALNRLSETQENDFQIQEISYNPFEEEIERGTDPILWIPYYDIFQPMILMSLDFKTILACMSVNSIWYETISNDTKLLCETLDFTVNPRKLGHLKDSSVKQVLNWAITGNRDGSKKNNVDDGFTRKRIVRHVELYDLNPTQDMQIMNLIFCDFSHHIRKITLKIETNSIFELFLKLPVKYTEIGHALESLHITGPFSKSLLAILLPLFKNLKHLEVKFLQNKPPNWFINQAKSNGLIYPNDPPKKGPFGLEKLELYNIDSNVDINFPRPFFLYNYIAKNLKALKFITLLYEGNLCKASDLYRLYHSASVTNMLLKLTSLESFNLNNSHLMCAPYFYTSKSIKRLQLYYNTWNPALLTCFDALPFQSNEFNNNINNNTVLLDLAPLEASRSKNENTLELLRLYKCKSDIHRGSQFRSLIKRFGCGTNLKSLFLEYTRLPFLYDEAGYDKYIRRDFPRLETLSFGGNPEVGDSTVHAIIKKSPIPRNIIVSHTSISIHGAWALIKAGIKRIGIQRCLFTIEELADIKQNANIPFIESMQYMETYRNNPRIV